MLTLFAGFIIAFWLDLTGVILHQWLGIAVGVLALYHLIKHRAWVSQPPSGWSRAGLAREGSSTWWTPGAMLGMFLMVATGVVISTWLSLSLGNYLAWRNVHVAASIATLLLVVLKIGMHWRWVVTVARRYVFPSRPAKETQPAGVPLPVQTGAESRLMGGPEFLKVMGIVGVAAAIPVARTLLSTVDASAKTVEGTSTESSGDDGVLQSSVQSPTAATLSSTTVTESATTTQSPTATQSLTTATESLIKTQNPTATVSPTVTPSSAAAQASDTCVVRCPRGCSYPWTLWPLHRRQQERTLR